MASLREVVDNLAGAALLAVCLILRPLLRPWYARWGASDLEVWGPLPGDGRIPDPLVTQTMATTIHAPAAEIWPWLAQLGQERGGLYSYELLENLAGCRVHNADQIRPDWELTVGERVRLGPEGYPVNAVIALERGQWLLLAGADPKTGIVEEPPQPNPTQHTSYTWVFCLKEQRDGTTRLITRNRLDYAPRTFLLRLTWEWLTDPIGFVMTRKMLLTIKQRVEHRAAFSRQLNDLPISS